MPFSRLIVIVGLVAALLAPQAARASSRQASIMQDDRLLLSSGDAARVAALDRMKALGVDEIHTQMSWRNESGSGFGPWDALVAGSRSRGMSVLLTLTGPTPVSDSDCPPGTPNRQICKPNVKKFQKWVTGVGRHYKGKISRWSVWNEPNLNGWLLPQKAKSGGTTYDYAARRYRDLFRAAVRGLDASGHGKDSILIGETSPIGNARAIPPVDFLRAVFCLDGKNRALTGKAARVRGCTPFAKLGATGVAIHPYTPAAACSPICGGGPHDITIASLGRLSPILDAAARRGRLPSGARTKVYITEFGFQSNPPNRGGTVSLAEQALYLNWSEAIAFHNPRIRAFANYELEDPGAVTFNTGLLFGSGKAKPSLAAWRVPIYVTKAKGGVRIFGGVRPGGAHRVTVQATNPGKAWRTARTVRSNGSGYIYIKLATAKTRFRLKFGSFVSRTARAR